jgi:NAD(P)-dependent dehydrogenase (short-subunit alcohol dehydrogenase family)
MLEADLSSLDSVRLLVENFRAEFAGLDVLINNAGGYFGYRELTREGFEQTFGVNHLAHFFLTLGLKEVLISSRTRIINVSSSAQTAGHIHFDDLMGEKKFAGFRAYAQAKLANIIFSYELDRRWGEHGITANAVHPGAVATNFGEEAKPVFRSLIKIGKPFLKTPQQGADTLVYLATSPEVEGISGKYFIRRKPVRSNRESYDQEVWKRLWEVSEELTGIKD